MVYETYVDIQRAWSNNDIDKVRHLLSDELYNTYRMQIMTMINKNQRNEMSNFQFVECFINKVTLKDDLFIIVTYLNVTCIDYMVDSFNHDVIRGSKRRINDYYYKLTFEMAKVDSVDICPSCHAKTTKTGNSVKCEYCGSIINRKSTNLVLVDKKMVRQSVK